MQEFCIGDSVQLRDGNVYKIENIRYIPKGRAKDGIGGNLYTLQCLAFPSEYKSYYETRMHNEALVVQFTDQLDDKFISTIANPMPAIGVPTLDTNIKSKVVSKSRPIDTRPLAKVYILAEYRQRKQLRRRA